MRISDWSSDVCSSDLIQAFNLDREPQWVRLEQLCASGQIGEYDIILSCLEGVSTRRLFHCVAPLSAHRPLIISIFAGLVLRYRNDGYSVRQRSDLLWLNCRSEEQTSELQSLMRTSYAVL